MIPSIAATERLSEGRGNRKILSLHWGFGFGGVSKYAALLEKINLFSPIEIHTVCILRRGCVVDKNTLSLLRSVSIIHINSIFDFSWIKILRDEVAIYRPDLLITHGFNAHFASWLIGYFQQKPVKRVASYHGEYYGATRLKKIVGVFYDWFTEYYLKKHVSAIAVVAGVCEAHLVRSGVSRTSITVIHNGINEVHVNLDVVSRLRSEWCGEEDSILIGVVSRLEPIKGVDVLLEAFMLVNNSFPKTKLIIVGSGVQENFLRRWVDKHNLKNNVIFAGYRSDIPEVLQAFDLYVLPSRREAHSIALLEAMRAGKPIVATDVGGNTESVRDGQEALVIPAVDTIAMEKALTRLIADNSMRENLANNARGRFLVEFTEDVMLKRTSAWLSRCICLAE